MAFLSEGLQFIIYSVLKKDMHEGVEKYLPLAHRKVPLLVYKPEKAYKGLIINFTGFSVHGYKDSRMVSVSRAFQKLGYLVITPQVKEIDSLHINPQSIDDIREIITSITKDTSLNPQQMTPAIFAPSYTAGMCALAVAEMPAGSVSSLCLLGSFCNMQQSIDYVLSGDTRIDDYGMHILMKNFLPYALGENEKLAQIIQAAIEDNGFKRAIPVLPRAIAEADPATVSLYKKLIADNEYRNKILKEAWQNIPDSDSWNKKFDLSSHVEAIRNPVTIIHGKNDNVIAPSQSVLLYELLKKHNKNTYLELTGLLDHGDVQFSLTILKEIKNMAKAFDHFLKNTKNGKYRHND